MALSSRLISFSKSFEVVLHTVCLSCESIIGIVPKPVKNSLRDFNAKRFGFCKITKFSSRNTFGSVLSKQFQFYKTDSVLKCDFHPSAVQSSLHIPPTFLNRLWSPGNEELKSTIENFSLWARLSQSNKSGNKKEITKAIQRQSFVVVLVLFREHQLQLNKCLQWNANIVKCHMNS